MSALSANPVRRADAELEPASRSSRAVVACPACSTSPLSRAHSETATLSTTLARTAFGKAALSRDRQKPLDGAAQVRHLNLRAVNPRRFPESCKRGGVPVSSFAPAGRDNVDVRHRSHRHVCRSRSSFSWPDRRLVTGRHVYAVALRGFALQPRTAAEAPSCSIRSVCGTAYVVLHL